MTNRSTIARQAMVRALRMRRRGGYGLEEAICVYDLSQRLDVEVRFFGYP